MRHFSTTYKNLVMVVANRDCSQKLGSLCTSCETNDGTRRTPCFRKFSHPASDFCCTRNQPHLMQPNTICPHIAPQSMLTWHFAWSGKPHRRLGLQSRSMSDLTVPAKQRNLFVMLAHYAGMARCQHMQRYGLENPNTVCKAIGGFPQSTCKGLS